MEGAHCFMATRLLWVLWEIVQYLTGLSISLFPCETGYQPLLGICPSFFFNNFPFGPRTLQVRALYALHLMLLTSVFLLGCELTWWLVMFGTLYYFFILTPVLPRLLPLWHEAFSKYAISAFQLWLPVLGNHRPIKVPLKPGFYPSLFRVNSRICQYYA